MFLLVFRSTSSDIFRDIWGILFSPGDFGGEARKDIIKNL